MASFDVDDTDRKIIEAVERDARISMRSLADRLHISRANAYARLKRLIEAGVITGFHAHVDPVALGLGTSAYLTITIDQSHWRHIHQSLRSISGVEHIALVGGEFDVVLMVRARDNADLRRLVLDDIQSVDGVLSTRTLLIFDESSPERPPLHRAE